MNLEKFGKTAAGMEPVFRRNDGVSVFVRHYGEYAFIPAVVLEFPNKSNGEF